VNALTTAAAEYLSAGFSIIALSGKQPNAAIHPHGLRQPLVGQPETSEDLALLEQVFLHRDTTGVGIVIQYPYAVVDIDGEDGAQQFAGVIGGTTFNETPVARTARGLHVWFGFLTREPQRTVKLGPKLDLKGVGGYVAAPPSVHPSGFVYEWLVPIAPGGVLNPPTLAPDGLAAVLRDQANTLGEYRQLRPAGQPASLAALVRHVRHLEEGNRNNGLHWAASAAADDGFPREEAEPQLIEAAVLAGLDRQEAMVTIRSAYRRAR